METKGIDSRVMRRVWSEEAAAFRSLRSSSRPIVGFAERSWHQQELVFRGLAKISVERTGRPAPTLPLFESGLPGLTHHTTALDGFGER